MNQQTNKTALTLIPAFEDRYKTQLRSDTRRTNAQNPTILQECSNHTTKYQNFISPRYCSELRRRLSGKANRHTRPDRGQR